MNSNDSQTFVRTHSESTWSQWIMISNEYSTTETMIGRWIDGKPIYRKVIKITSLSSNNTYEHNISNLNEVISVRGIARFEGTKGSGWQPISRVVTDGIITYGIGIGDIDVNNSTGTFLLQIGTSYTNFSKAYVIIEYTKTTD